MVSTLKQRLLKLRLSPFKAELTVKAEPLYIKIRIANNMQPGLCAERLS